MRTLGTYQLLRKIGSGGMAVVWSARRVNRDVGDKFVAIKILARHLAENPSYREMFIGEAKLSLVLNHANIVTVFEVVEDQGECYMVMELVEGLTLSQLLRRLSDRNEKLPEHVAVYVVAELLRALAYAHSLKSELGSTIVHRDVSPQNVMVTTSGEVKLMDFGIARFSTEETAGNFVKGKLQYMPPEQLARKTREPTVDLFAVGGILQELLEGRRFRSAVDQELLLGMVMRGDSPALTVDIPEALDQLRRQLLEPDPDRRLASAKQALGMIYAWPGYRNASLELEDLVCEFVERASSTSMPAGVATPKGEIKGDATGEVISVAVGVAEVEVPEPEPTEVEAAEELEASSSRSDAELDSAPTTGEVDSELNPVPRSSATGGGERHELDHDTADTEVNLPGMASAASSAAFEIIRPGPNPRMLAGIGAALLALLFLALWGFGVFGGEDPPQLDEDALANAPVAGEIITRELEPADTTETGAEETGSSAEGEDEPSADGGEDPAGNDGGDDEAEADDNDPNDDDDDPNDNEEAEVRVRVEFVANEFYFVYLKVGGRIIAVEPTRKLSLPVGNHAVFLRQKKTDPWKRAGTIKLSKGGSYRVEMKKPAGLRQSRN